MRHRPKFYFILFIFFTICLLNYYTGVLRSTKKQFSIYEAISLYEKNSSENKVKIDANLLKCNTFYENNKHAEVWSPADPSLQEMRIVRGMLLYYPSDRTDWFEQEFKWLYRSWVEMQKHEPLKWRTDLIVFTDIEKLGTNIATFTQLECTVTNLRTNKEQKPLCTLINYVAIKDRKSEKSLNKNSLNNDELYDELYRHLDVFDENAENLWKFYEKLKEINHYNYADSILMAFDGYKYLKNNFDFLLRSDMDVFLTPGFAKWIPENCNDFIVGGGGYSHDFNMKRLRKAAKYMNLEFLEKRNLGSTWYSTPAQFRLVSYFTLVSMVYISSEEFSETERQGKVGTILWPGNFSFCNNKLAFFLKNSFSLEIKKS